ncbi:MAG: heme-binding domain-containing protein [Ferruginibacter sp.]
MNLKKKILLVVATGMLAIQFMQPTRNKSMQVFPTDLTKVIDVPANILPVFQTACYDCHSNNTVYTWYSHFQPMAWIMERHINKGKEKLNFSDFGSNSRRKQISKLKEMLNQIKDDEMPITSYKLMHKSARLSQDEKTMLVNWLQSTADSLSATD